MRPRTTRRPNTSEQDRPRSEPGRRKPPLEASMSSSSPEPARLVVLLSRVAQAPKRRPARRGTAPHPGRPNRRSGWRSAFSAQVSGRVERHHGRGRQVPGTIAPVSTRQTAAESHCSMRVAKPCSPGCPDSCPPSPRARQPPGSLRPPPTPRRARPARSGRSAPRGWSGNGSSATFGLGWIFQVARHPPGRLPPRPTCRRQDLPTRVTATYARRLAA